MEIDRDSPFYEGKVPVRVERVGGHDVSKEEVLTLRIFPGSKKNSQGQHVGVLYMEITKTSDLFFLYTLAVSEEEFPELKSEQSLLVDFAAFPPKFVELLEACKHKHPLLPPSSPHPTHDATEEADPKLAEGSPREPIEDRKTSSTSNWNGGKFVATLDLGGFPVFKIVESNQFKQLTHLALRFQPATDASTKVYLASQLHLSQKECERRGDRVKVLEKKCADQKEKLESLNSIVAQLNAKVETVAESMRNQHSEALARQKEESLKLLAQTQNAGAEQARKQQEAAESRIKELEQQLAKLQTDFRQVYEEKAGLDSSNQQLRIKVESLEKFASEGTAEMGQLRAANKELESAKFELEKKWSEQQLTLVATRQQLHDKEEVLARTNSMLEEVTKRKAVAEDKVASYKSSTNKLQRKLELSINEINKGNRVIEDLQEEIKQAKAKLRTKNLVIRQQEKAVDQLRSDVEKEREMLQRTKGLLQEEKKHVTELTSALEASKAKLEECNKLLESNQNVIEFLNKEINQAHMPATARYALQNHTPTTLSREMHPPYSSPSPSRSVPIPPFHAGSDLFPSPSSTDNIENINTRNILTKSPVAKPSAAMYSGQPEEEEDDLEKYISPAPLQESKGT